MILRVQRVSARPCLEMMHAADFNRELYTNRAPLRNRPNTGTATRAQGQISNRQQGPPIDGKRSRAPRADDSWRRAKQKRRCRLDSRALRRRVHDDVVQVRPRLRDVTAIAAGAPLGVRRLWLPTTFRASTIPDDPHVRITCEDPAEEFESGELVLSDNDQLQVPLRVAR